VYYSKGESPQLGEISLEKKDAFEKRRQNLLDPPILALPGAEGLFNLDTDASQNQIGCCLFQDQPDGSKHPVDYCSRGLTSAEKNYSTTEKECLAIVWEILQLRPYLECKRFVIRTDHNSLRWVLNLADAQGWLARWRLLLLEFDFEVQYSPGEAHHGADTMSRLPSTYPEIMSPHRSIDTEIPCFTVDAAAVDPMLLLVENLRNIQAADLSCCKISTLFGAHPLVEYDDSGVLGRLLPSGHFEPELPELLRKTTPVTVVRDLPLPLPESTPHVRVDPSQLRRGVQSDAISIDMAYAADEVLPQTLQLEELIAEQAHDAECRELADLCGDNTVFDHNDAGLLVRKEPLDGSEQIFVPAALRPRILHLEHYPRVAGHTGVSRMFRSLLRRYFWRNMSADVAETVRQCAVSAKNRILERKRTSFLKLFPASEPLVTTRFVTMTIRSWRGST
jgi:hypothetical protein